MFGLSVEIMSGVGIYRSLWVFKSEAARTRARSFHAFCRRRQGLLRAYFEGYLQLRGLVSKVMQRLKQQSCLFFFLSLNSASLTCCELAQLEPVKGVLAGLSPVYFTINSSFEGSLMNICRNVGFCSSATFYFISFTVSAFPCSCDVSL